MRKKILVHLGPHKTGSTAIQAYFSQHRERLAAEGVHYVSNATTHRAALELSRRRFDPAAEVLKEVAAEISKLPASIALLSHEDFSGELLGRNGARRIYPRLNRGMEVIREGLSPHAVQFIFFVRDMSEWLPSAYAQNVRYRGNFGSFEQFKAQIEGNVAWADILATARRKFPSTLTVAEYSKDPVAGVATIAGLLGLPRPAPEDVQVANASIGPELMAEFERINSIAEHRELIPVYKERATLLSNKHGKKFPVDVPVESVSYSEWPPRRIRNSDPGLQELSLRVDRRVPKQADIENLLPPVDADLRPMLEQYLPLEQSLAEGPRRDIEVQAGQLEYYFKGKSRLACLTGLAISYLRRDTPHTGHARILFQRIWSEHGTQMAYELNARWIVSSLQTFADHGINRAQREAGLAGFFYANMIKIYEGERALERRPPDHVYESTTPEAPHGFTGLDRFKLGATDLMLNVNAHLLEIAQKDRLAGLLVSEFLLRTKHSQTVFSRMDKSRKSYGLSVPNFEDTWSFFVEP